MLTRLFKEDSGVVTIEWIILATVLAAAVTAFLGNVRNAIASESGDITDMIVSLDQSVRVPPAPTVHVCAPRYGFCTCEGVHDGCNDWCSCGYCSCCGYCGNSYVHLERSGYLITVPARMVYDCSCDCGLEDLQRALRNKYSVAENVQP